MYPDDKSLFLVERFINDYAFFLGRYYSNLNRISVLIKLNKPNFWQKLSNMENKYNAEMIKVLEGLEGVRKKFDVVELSRKIKKKGDILVLSQELKIKPRILNSAIDEGRVLQLIPEIQKSKAGILSGLKTDREIRKFIEKFNFNEISPKQLREEVTKWRKEIQKNPLMLLTQREHDLIIGSLLGDASIRQREKNSCFRVSHSLKQKDYINFKFNLLKNFKFSEFKETKRKIKKKNIDVIDLSTHTHPVFNYYRNLFYKNGKKIITKDMLNKLNPRSLAFWICDDGSYNNRQGYIVLCTNSFSLNEHRLMKKLFNERFGLDPTIGFRDGKYYYLRFKQEDSKKLIEIIKSFIPKCMSYKIGGNK